MKLQIFENLSEQVLAKISRVGQQLVDKSEEQKVILILDVVKQGGKAAIEKYRLEYDRLEPPFEKISQEQINLAATQCEQSISEAIDLSIANVTNYHASQIQESKVIETTEGLTCWRESRAIESVGLYVPGGSAALFSSLIMLAVPAKLAGCKRIVVCTPATGNLEINTQIAYIAKQLELNEIYLIGGAQAIAFMAYGTESISKVDKIFGPGNRFVTLAKQLVASEGIAIDLPAGPSEVLVIADKTANPDFVALDLLSQAEHGPDSQVILLSDNLALLKSVQQKVEEYVKSSNRASILQQSLDNSFAVLLQSTAQAIELSNIYAPEHLILACDEPEQYLNKIQNAGSVFIGHYSAEVFGDYLSGPNHTLPTAGFAKTTSGVSLDSFVKQISFQKVTKSAACQISQKTYLMAMTEGLQAHALAAKIRSETN